MGVKVAGRVGYGKKIWHQKLNRNTTANSQRKGVPDSWSGCSYYRDLIVTSTLSLSLCHCCSLEFGGVQAGGTGMFRNSPASPGDVTTVEATEPGMFGSTSVCSDVTQPAAAAEELPDCLQQLGSFLLIIIIIFNCYDSDTVNDVKHFLDVYDIRTVYQERRAAFLHKTSFLDNNVLQTVLVCCS